MFTLVFPVLVLNCCLTNHPKFSLKQQTCILSVFVDQGPECGLAGGIQLRVIHKAAVCVLARASVISKLNGGRICLQSKLIHMTPGRHQVFTGCWPETPGPCLMSSTEKLTKWEIVSLRANERRQPSTESQSLFVT